MKYRIFWIPQVPMQPFHWAVDDPQQGKAILDLLADYDKFQFENHVKPDYCNAGGLQVLEQGEWVDWCDEDGNSIDEMETLFVKDAREIIDSIEPQCRDERNRARGYLEHHDHAKPLIEALKKINGGCDRPSGVAGDALFAYKKLAESARR